MWDVDCQTNRHAHRPQFPADIWPRDFGGIGHNPVCYSAGWVCFWCLCGLFPIGIWPVDVADHAKFRRQLVTPAQMLGRVNAVIQAAIYGMRPLGALLGGAVVSMTSPGIGLIVVIASFLLSFLAAAFSGLISIKQYAIWKRRCIHKPAAFGSGDLTVRPRHCRGLSVRAIDVVRSKVS
jgi:hypothetical protein